MPVIDIEMHALSHPGQCIDGALATITATRRTLGAGTPTTGSYLSAITQLSGRKEEATTAATSRLAKLGLGREAWSQNSIPRINAWISCHESSRWHANSVAHTTTQHALAITKCRIELDKLVTELEDQKTAVLRTYFTETFLAAQTQDVAFAAAGLDEHKKYVGELTSKAADLATGVQHSTKRLQEFFEKAITCANRPPAVAPANSHICMPAQQLLDVSEILAAYTQSIPGSTCSPDFLAAVQKTHGEFSTMDFIPALSVFIEIYNMLLTTVTIKLDLQAEHLANAARDYLLTDATSAESLKADARQVDTPAQRP